MPCCRASPAKAPPSTSPRPRRGAVREYDLASQERFVRGRMPTMEIINERFARNVRVGLFGLMRRTAEVLIDGVRVQKFGEFLREITSRPTSTS